jgi:hypothetical protein
MVGSIRVPLSTPPHPLPPAPQNPEARALYFHSKGARYRRDMPFLTKFNGRWRALMTHFVIMQHRHLLQDILADDSPYVAVGALLHRVAPFHFPGNFWIAKCSYVNTLPRIHTLNTTDRMGAEFWIGMGANSSDVFKACWEVKVTECHPGRDICVVEDYYKQQMTCGRQRPPPPPRKFDWLGREKNQIVVHTRSRSGRS